MKANININQVNAAELINWLYPNQSTSQGLLTLNLQGESFIGDVDSMIKQFRGSALIHVQNMLLLNHKIDTRYVDIFSLLYKKMTSRDDTTRIQCLALRTRNNAGSATLKIILGN